MGWGEWASWPMFWGGGTSRASRIYEGLVRARGEGHYASDPDASVNLELRAAALAIADAESALERSQLQAHPHLATDLLPPWERALGRVPSPEETIGERQEALRRMLAHHKESDLATVLSTLEELVGPAVQKVLAHGWHVAVLADPTDPDPVLAIFEVLAPWLSAGTTLSVVESTPFVLGQSRLAAGAL